jgi:hypothetical protein
MSSSGGGSVAPNGFGWSVSGSAGCQWLRQASVRAGDPQGVNVWAGTGFRNAKSATVADIMAGLT